MDPWSEELPPGCANEQGGNIRQFFENRAGSDPSLQLTVSLVAFATPALEQTAKEASFLSASGVTAVPLVACAPGSAQMRVLRQRQDGSLSFRLLQVENGFSMRPPKRVSEGTSAFSEKSWARRESGCNIPRDSPSVRSSCWQRERLRTLSC